MEDVWIQVLKNWPIDVARRGIVVTNFGESIEFDSYMLFGTVLLLERPRPDAMGGRRVMVQLNSVAMIKVIDPIDMERFTSFGFSVPTKT